MHVCLLQNPVDIIHISNVRYYRKIILTSLFCLLVSNTELCKSIMTFIRIFLTIAQHVAPCLIAKWLYLYLAFHITTRWYTQMITNMTTETFDLIK